MRFRPITEDDIPQVAEIQARAFRASPERYITTYRDGGRFDWRSGRLLENDEGRPVAGLVAFQRRMSLLGGELPASLIAAVGVPPEERRRGYARGMMTGLLEELHAARLPISLLYPFSIAFYNQLGYALVSTNWHLTLHPRAIPDTPERMAVGRALAPTDDAEIRACYAAARAMPQHNGWLERTEWEWETRIWKEEHEVVRYPATGPVQGYLIYTLTNDWRLGQTSATIVEWVSTTDESWRAILGFLSALGEQAQTITYNAPAQMGPALLASLREPMGPAHPHLEFTFRQAGHLAPGFMLRVVHLASALRERRYPAGVQGDLILRLADPQLPANHDPVHLHINGGQASVAPATGPFRRGQRASIESDIGTFSQIFGGALTAETARTIGRLQGDDESCQLLTAAFAAAPLFVHQVDWF